MFHVYRFAITSVGLLVPLLSLFLLQEEGGKVMGKRERERESVNILEFRRDMNVRAGYKRKNISKNV